MTCTQIILKFQYTHCSPKMLHFTGLLEHDDNWRCKKSTTQTTKALDRQISNFLKCSPQSLALLFFTAIHCGNTWRDGLQSQALSIAIQLSGELLEQFKALFPVLPAHRTPCAGHSILRDNQVGLKHVLEGHGMNYSTQTPPECPVQSSFILHRHTSLRETFMYM